MERKRLLVIFVALAIGAVALTSRAHAVSPMSLEDKEFFVLLYCDDSVEDYCRDGINTDRFLFEGDDDFQLGAFEDADIFGFETAEGEYEEWGPTFVAEFTAMEEVDERYEFYITGFGVGDTLILGILDATYSEFEFPDFDFERKDDATCFFIGFPR